MLYSEYIEKNNIPKYNEYRESYTLNDEQFMELEEAVKKWLPTHLKNVNYNTSCSYHIKGQFEFVLGYYISNYDLKIVMDKLGYIKGDRPTYENGMNPYYNISSKEFKLLEQYAMEKHYNKFNK